MKSSPMKTLSNEKRYLREKSLEVQKVREAIEQSEISSNLVRNVRLALPKVDY
jgi:hypothetical protein